MMNWIETPDSSTLARFRYSIETRVLSVEFKNGGRYNYFDVPEIVFERLKTTPSKGQFLAQNIKNVYRYARA
jgi:hypothetical protein